MFYFTTRTTLLTLIAGLSSMPTLAADNVAPDPACIYQETDLKTYGGQAYVAPKEIRSVDGKLNAELNVVFTNSKEA